ncbi:MAG TPA: SGNH/GDSL hydrolase family protein, partial [Longimicrobium sp.]
MWFLAVALLAACDTANVVSAPTPEPVPGPAPEPPRTTPQLLDPNAPHPDTVPLLSVDTLDARCPVPRALLPRFTADSRIVKALRNGEPLTIVAIGSSSTEGVGASTLERAYPGQMQRMMMREWPRSPVRMVNVGIGGNTAEHMVARFSRDVYAYNPDVVIFQAGTIEALERAPIAPFMRVFRDGIAQ